MCPQHRIGDPKSGCPFTASDSPSLPWLWATFHHTQSCSVTTTFSTTQSFSVTILHFSHEPEVWGTTLPPPFMAFCTSSATTSSTRLGTSHPGINPAHNTRIPLLWAGLILGHSSSCPNTNSKKQTSWNVSGLLQCSCQSSPVWTPSMPAHLLLPLLSPFFHHWEHLLFQDSCGFPHSSVLRPSSHIVSECWSSDPDTFTLGPPGLSTLASGCALHSSSFSLLACYGLAHIR